MLVLRFSDSSESVRHVGAGRLSKDVGLAAHRDFLENIQADGHELEIIKQQFQNIPMTTNRVVIWNGEMAFFIFDNLKI